MKAPAKPKFRTTALLISLAYGLAINPLHAQTTPREAARQAKEALPALLEERAASSTRGCTLGVQFGLADLRVIALTSRESSLRPGDNVISIAGDGVTTWDQAIAALSKHPSSGTLSLEIEREGEVEELTARCVNSERIIDSRYRILSAASKRNWHECLAAIDVAESVSGPRAELAWKRFDCSRFANRSLDNSRASRLAYEAWRLAIEESRWDRAAWPKVRGDAIGALSAFERLGEGRLANDLQRLINSVDAGPSTARAPSVAPSPRSTGSISTGTGFLVNPLGGLITSHHVIDGARTITVACGNQPAAPARLISSSASTDLAYLTSGALTPSYLSLAPNRTATVGERVFTYGFPVSHILGDEPKFTEGSISALSGIGGEQAYMQISIPVQPGNSGGPVVNDRGQVVGVVAAVAAVAPFLRSTGTLPQNVNWAVKAEYASLIFDPPATNASTANREAAIERVRSSLCFIRAEK